MPLVARALLLPTLLLLVAMLGLTACGSKPAGEAAANPAAAQAKGKLKVYELEGEVLRVDAPGKLVTIKHGQIQDKAGNVWMEPMTMEFPVPDAALLAKMKQGLQIKGKVTVNDDDFSYWLNEASPK